MSDVLGDMMTRGVYVCDVDLRALIVVCVALHTTQLHPTMGRYTHHPPGGQYTQHPPGGRYTQYPVLTKNMPQGLAVDDQFPTRGLLADCVTFTQQHLQSVHCGCNVGAERDNMLHSPHCCSSQHRRRLSAGHGVPSNCVSTVMYLEDWLHCTQTGCRGGE